MPNSSTRDLINALKQVTAENNRKKTLGQKVKRAIREPEETLTKVVDKAEDLVEDALDFFGF